MMSQVKPLSNSGALSSPGGARLLDRAGETAVGQVELAADVDERVAHLDGIGRDQHRLEEQVRRVLEDPAVLERARLALVRVRAQVVRLARRSG
jgi:hypothetical protein